MVLLSTFDHYMLRQPSTPITPAAWRGSGTPTLRPSPRTVVIRDVRGDAPAPVATGSTPFQRVVRDPSIVDAGSDRSKTDAAKAAAHRVVNGERSLWLRCDAVQWGSSSATGTTWRVTQRVNAPS
jgi:hypothetical protein